MTCVVVAAKKNFLTTGFLLSSREFAILVNTMAWFGLGGYLYGWDVMVFYLWNWVE